MEDAQLSPVLHYFKSHDLLGIVGLMKVMVELMEDVKLSLVLHFWSVLILCKWRNQRRKY